MQILRRTLLPAGFFIITLFSLQSNLAALEISNTSQNRIGAAVIIEQGDHKNPIFLKIMEPGTTLDHQPEMKGPFVVSVAVIDTKETFRLEEVSASESVVFDGKEVKKV
ncbi:MAG: hypothetical protein H6757_04580 [Candidatus Omnitrophica bacterium]|nr:hypothetical protein [Candidatus Omnitrophota bacterium]